MRRLLIIVAVVAVWAAGLCRAEEPTTPPTPPETTKSIGLVAVGPVDAAMMEEIRKYAEENVFFPVKLLPAKELTGGNLDAEGIAAAKDLDASLAFLVTVIMPEKDLTSHGIYLPEHKVAVVNAKATKTEGLQDGVYLRRVRRGVMRSIGMLGGLETCPNPQCCMSSYETLEQLDQIGNNFCPPCLGALTDELAGTGLKMIDFPAE